MKRTFLGDIHGDFEVLKRALHLDKGPIIQVGDMGLGFPHQKKVRGLWVPDPDSSDPVEFNPRMQFIRGNHDDPVACRKYPNYMGDYGVDSETGIFFISGGESIDRKERTMGIDWWEDEQLTYRELDDAITRYYEVRPSVVLSHECPTSVIKEIHSHHHYPSRTSNALEAMFVLHQPRVWIFGHHHKVWRRTINHTDFICVAINDRIAVDI